MTIRLLVRENSNVINLIYEVIPFKRAMQNVISALFYTEEEDLPEDVGPRVP